MSYSDDDLKRLRSLYDPLNVRTWPFYPVPMPLTKDKKGPATVGKNATEITFEVWDHYFNSYGSFEYLPDAINEAMKLTKERQTTMNKVIALSLVFEDYNDAEYEQFESWVDDGHVKHDITAYYSVFLRKVDNTYWKIHFQKSNSYGLDEDNLFFYQVEKKEKVVVEWVEVV